MMTTKTWLLIVIAFTLNLAISLADNNTPNPYPLSVQAKLENGPLKVYFQAVNIPPEDRPPELAYYKGRPIAMVAIMFSGLAEGQEFTYFIHEKPIANNDCNTAGDHWNPAARDTWSASYRCDARRPGLCEAGDLSGKHGKLKGTGTSQAPVVTYYDLSLKLTYSRRGMLGKSLVVYDSSNKPILCGNIIDASMVAQTSS
ncbi:hypothetical protein PGT21_003649 [Puccinia graminis f. sp. tritici]|uniref:Superoxide dismutase copper/zinc binding domain-containing protein n=1 Tax=Puccinia graminis f. sp. tritici TaxID=56615 RepID=A0A5B0NPL5_PUCGR|nr:hypothetical protein PGTUg99_032765 [Puccinia graminis f. sp. tritici]KAA1090506.1 hypothetical protein PGT21_003649 [Puccinia graminis f. sp. tritici]